MLTQVKKLLLLVVLVLVSVVGCSQSKSPAPTPAPSAASSSPVTEGEPSAIPTDEPNLTPTIGEAFAYDDGLKVQVLDLKRGKIDATYPGTEFKKGKPCVYLTIKVTNGSTETLDTTMQLQAVGGSEGEDLSVLRGADFKPSIDTPILAGKADSQRYAIQTDPDSLTEVALTLTVDFNHDPITFIGDLTSAS